MKLDRPGGLDSLPTDDLDRAKAAVWDLLHRKATP
jgi:hypothetical protein